MIFQDTFNFTNTGTMLGIPGFQFDTASSSQPRRMAASFYNRSGASVTGSDSPLGVSQVNGIPLQTQLNISFLFAAVGDERGQPGTFVSGAAGRLRLKGNKWICPAAG